MKQLILCLVLLAGCASEKKSFVNRFEDGNKAAATPAGKTYDMSLGSIIQPAMQKCMPPDSSAQRINFSLVGNISSSGIVSSIEVQPGTEVSACFSEEIGRSNFPSPPYSPYPLTVEMRLVQ